MTMDWFRHSNDMSTDAKLTYIAKQAGARRCEMTALWNCLCEHASAHENRGFVGDIDLEEIAFTQEIDLVTIKALHALLCNKGRVTSDGYLKQWKRYNDVTKKPAMSGAERVRKYRENKKKKCEEKQQSPDGYVTECNESNDVTPHNSTSHRVNNKNSPLPPQPVDKKSEVLKKSDLEIEGGRKKDFKILDQLDAIEISVAKSACEGWDIHHLAGIFDQSVKSGRLEIPRSPSKAFNAWLKSYTKGKRP